MVYHVELVGVGDTQLFQMVFLVYAFESDFGGGVEVPECTVKVEEYVFVWFHFWSICLCHSKSATAAAWLTLRDRVIRFLTQHCVYPAGPKTFYILMNQIAADLNDSRLDISRTLNDMQADGLLTLHRGRIEIPMLERLLM